MDRYKATKLSVLEKPENGKTAKDLEETNKKIFAKAGELGLISGFYAVEPGMSFQGHMEGLPNIGDSMVLSHPYDGLWTSPVTEIIQESEYKWAVKTRNSTYLLEKLEENGKWIK